MMSDRPARYGHIVLAVHAGLLAFAAVYWGVFTCTDAPFIYHPDEPDVVGRAMRMAVTGDLNPHWFHYPTLLMYLLAAFFKLLQFFLDIPIELGLPVSAQGANPDAFVIYHAARLVTICFSLGTLYFILRLTSRVTSPLVASLAGLTFIGSHVVRDSAAYITVDMPMTFFVFASLALLVEFVDSAQRGQLKERYLWYGVVLGGLAAGIKYNGAAILLVVPLAMRLADMSLRWSLRRLPLAVLLSIAVFVVSTPYSILDMKTFFDPRIGMSYDFVHYSSGHPGADEGMSFLKAIDDLFNHHSVLVFLVLLSPLAARGASVRKPLVLVGLTFVLFLGMVMVAKVYFTRNLLPSIPASDCLTAAGVWAVVGMSLSRASRKQTVVRVVLPLVVAFAIAGGGALHSARATWRETRLPDNRTLAYDWITGNVSQGSRILYEAYCPQLYFSPNLEARYAWTISQVPFEELVRNYDYVVVSETQWRRYRTLRLRTYERLFEFSPLREWPSRPGKTRGPAIRMYSTGREAGT